MRDTLDGTADEAASIRITRNKDRKEDKKEEAVPGPEPSDRGWELLPSGPLVVDGMLLDGESKTAVTIGDSSALEICGIKFAFHTRKEST